ncbi:MAG: preprotein translocase subunit SecG [Acutalibacteraceae bacterium]|nr:preprotein translocase subunit SecG [Acutalibacteraceae bacterium]
MSIANYIIGSFIILFALVIIVAILLQEGRRSGINGAISGGADTFLSKNKARTADAFLSKWTKWISIVFFVLILLVNILAIIFAE